jgi:transposase-like protein
MLWADPTHAFPGLGQMKPEPLEIDRLRKEVTPLKAERDILKKAAAYFARDAISHQTNLQNGPTWTKTWTGPTYK